MIEVTRSRRRCASRTPPAPGRPCGWTPPRPSSGRSTRRKRRGRQRAAGAAFFSRIFFFFCATCWEGALKRPSLFGRRINNFLQCPMIKDHQTKQRDIERKGINKEGQIQVNPLILARGTVLKRFALRITEAQVGSRGETWASSRTAPALHTIGAFRMVRLLYAAVLG